MNKTNLSRVLLLIGGMLLTEVVLALTPDFEKCTSQTTSMEDRIAVCSRAIKSGKLSPQHLTSAYNVRGYAWHLKGNDDKAIADLGEVIRLNPQSAPAYLNRGGEWAQQGNFDKAIVDFSESIRLAPKESGAYFYRGLAQFCKEKYDAAATDFSEVLHLKTGDAYTVLWLYLSLAHDQKSDEAKHSLLIDATSIDQSKWPASVINLMADKSDPETVFKATTSTDAISQRNQLCEANFYVGEWYLLKGDKPKARSLFDRAVQDCPKDFDEFSAANVELRRLPK